MALQYLANGIVVGSIVAIAAVGLTLVYRILKLTNFAHGDMITIGAYTGLYLNISFGMSPWLAIPLAFAVGAGLSLLLDWLVWRRLRKLRAGTVSLIIASIGVALFLRHFILFLFGSRQQAYQLPIQMAEPLGSLPIRMTLDQKLVVLVALLLVLLLHLVLRYTTVGKAMRAMADNMDLAWVSGINVDRVIMWTWVIGGGLATTSGLIYALTRSFDFNLGWFLLLPLFAAIILGGVGNPYGAVLGGVLIGIGQEMSILWVPSQYKLAVGFIIMILTLLVYPRGILGERALR